MLLSQSAASRDGLVSPLASSTGESKEINCRTGLSLGEFLSTAELDDARWQWIRLVQAENLKSTLIVLRQGRTIPKSNQLNRLTPFLDQQGLLRVGGRLKHALLAYDE